MSDLAERIRSLASGDAVGGREYRSEIERLTAGLKTANKNHEHFEREWYFRGDRIAKLEAALDQISMIKLDKAGYITTLEQAVHIARGALQEVDFDGD